MTPFFHVTVAAMIATFAGWDPIVVLALIGYGYAACWIEHRDGNVAIGPPIC